MWSRLRNWLAKVLDVERPVKAPVISMSCRVYREKTDSWEAGPIVIGQREFLEASVKT